MEAFKNAAGTGGWALSNGALSDGARRFAERLLGVPIPGTAAECAERDREQLRWLSKISTRHEHVLQRFESAEAERRRQREQLEWLAKISDEHERQLRALLREEAELEQAQWRHQLAEEQPWDPAKHPRRGGPPNAGWFASKGSAGGSSGTSGIFSVPDAIDTGRDTKEPHRSHDSPSAKRSDDPGDEELAPAPSPEMLELAHAWHQTKRAHDQIQRDLNELPGRIASERRQLGSGGRYAHLHSQNLVKAQQDLATAKTLAPDLEKQLVDLEQRYRDSAYDNVPVYAMTPQETWTGGKGIEAVGRAVAERGSAMGLRPTGIEFDIAMGAGSILQIGRAALQKAATASPGITTQRLGVLRPYRGPGGGHHVPAKKAFEGVAKYNAKTALAMPMDELARYGLNHSTITGAQQRFYREFAKTGKKLTWTVSERIETEALVSAGLDVRIARDHVRKAIAALKRAGVSGPTRIPWGK